jgi:hypothetical protein
MANLPEAATDISLVGAAGNPINYQITITWKEQRTGKTNYGNAGDLETLSLTTRKQIYCTSDDAGSLC